MTDQSIPRRSGDQTLTVPPQSIRSVHSETVSQVSHLELELELEQNETTTAEGGDETAKKQEEASQDLLAAARDGDRQKASKALDDGADIKARTAEYNETALHLAARFGFDEVVALLLEKNAECDVVDEHGWTPLYGAANGGHTEVVRRLRDHGAAVETRTHRNFSPLESAIKEEHIDVVKVILEREIDINAQDDDGWTPLIWACRFSTTEIVGIILDKGADVDLQNNEGWNPLMEAGHYSTAEMVQLLVDRNAKLDIRNKHGWTTLLDACRYAKTEVIRILVEKGANINIPNNDGWTPLIMACRYCEMETIRLLVEHNAEIDVTNNDGRTALITVCRNPNLDAVKLLISRGANVEAQEPDGWTALQFAVRYADSEIVQVLLDHGADPNLAEFDGWTALHKVPYNETKDGQSTMARALLEKGAKHSLTRDDQRTPLHMASEEVCPDVVKVLLEFNAPVDALDVNGWTPLHLASTKGSGEVVKQLLDAGAQAGLRTNDTEQTPLGLAIVRYIESEDEKDPEENAANSKGTTNPARNAVDLLVKQATLTEKQHVVRQLDHEDKLAEIIKLMGMDSEAAEDTRLIWFAARKDRHHKILELLGQKYLPADIEAKTALQLAAYFGKHVVVWWLLKTTPLSKETQRDRQTAQLLAEKGRRISIQQDAEEEEEEEEENGASNARTKDRKLEGNDDKDQNVVHSDHHDARPKPSSDQKNSAPNIHRQNSLPLTEQAQSKYSLTLDMLKDPPPVVGLSDSDEPYQRPSVEKTAADIASEYDAVIVDFYRRNERLDFLRRSRNVWNVIYKPAMGSNNADSGDAGGPEEIMEQARRTLASISPEDAKEKSYSRSELQMRWIHLPANNMQWMEDLTRRVCLDNKLKREEYLPLRNFLRMSWHEVSSGAEVPKFMKPSCSKERVPKKPPKNDSTHKQNAPEQSSNPAEQPSTTETPSHEATDTNKPTAPTRAQTEQNKGQDPEFYDRTALYIPYLTFGKCYSKDPTPDSQYRTRYDALMTEYKDKTIHGTRSLDRFYYQGLKDMKERDQNQVLTRALMKFKNGDGVGDEPWWPIITVDQLWVWVVDEETIITCATHRQDGFGDLVAERIFNRLRDDQSKETRRPPPSNVSEMSRFIVQFCINFMNTINWESSTSDISAAMRGNDAVTRSTKEIFADTINKKAANEKDLFSSFRDKMTKKLTQSGPKQSARKADKASEKSEMASSKTLADSTTTSTTTGTLVTTEKDRSPFTPDSEKTDPDASNAAGQTAQTSVVETNYDEIEEWRAISIAASLLDEVKDIREELTMLRALISQQKSVWEILLGESSRLGDAKAPAYILQDIEEMCEMTDTIQKSVHEILNLEQNGISITEAILARDQAEETARQGRESARQGRESARQGKTLMVFTIVTIVFTPMSFLSSLFALNVTSFQHDGNGNLLYRPSWIFPMIFCVSIAVTVPLMVIAYYIEEVRKFVKEEWGSVRRRADPLVVSVEGAADKSKLFLVHVWQDKVLRCILSRESAPDSRV